jgi:Dolichyl-phosphate-mannose-protein mannosyltransferase
MPSNQLQANSRGFNSAIRFVPWVVIAVLWCSILLVAPVGKHILIDADEGSVGMKGMLYQQGYRAFVDLPPVHPLLFHMILGGWFRLFETGLWSGRFLVWIFSGVFLAAFYKATSDRFSRLGGLLAVLALFSSAGFFRLSISLMETIPAWTLAISAVALLGPPQRPKGRARIVFSSALLALSMTIALNTVLIIPGILAELARLGAGERKDKIRNSFMWAVGWAGVFVLLSFWWRVDFQQVLSGHDAGGTYQLSHFFMSSLPVVILVLSGLVGGGRRLLHDAILPFTWLAVATTVLLIDAPVRWHGEFLLAMPLGMLAGAAVVLWCASSTESEPSSNRRMRLAIIGLFVLFAVPGRMVSSAWLLRDPRYAMDEHLVASLREVRASGSKTAAAIHHQGYLVEAGLLSPPGLSVNFKESRFIEDMEKWNPDVLLFYRADVDMNLAFAMREHYFPAVASDGVLLFKRKQGSGVAPDLAAFAWQSVVMSPYDREAQIELARLLKSSGRDAEACARYRMVLRWSDGAPEWIMEIAGLLATSGDERVRNCAEAMEWVNFGAEKFPGRPDLAELKGEILRLCAGSNQP